MWFIPWFIWWYSYFHDLIIFTSERISSHLFSGVCSQNVFTFPFFLCMNLLFYMHFLLMINLWCMYFHVICFCTIQLLSYVIFSWLYNFHMWFLTESEETVMWSVWWWCGVYDVFCPCSGCSRMMGSVYCMKCAGVPSSLTTCCALVILSDPDFSAVVSLHPPESFWQTALLTRWSLHTAWGKQNRLCCWEGDYIHTCKTISLRHHFHIIVFPQHEEQYLSLEAYQWEQQVRRLKH